MNIREALSIPIEPQMFALMVAVSSVIVSGFVMLAAGLLRRRSAPLRYGILLAGIFGLLAAPVLVGIGVKLPVRLLPAGEEVVKVPAEMLPAFLDRPPHDAPPAVEEVPASVGDPVGALLLCFWAFFAIVGLVRLLFGLGKQRRAIIGRSWSAAWWTAERQASLAEKVGLRRFPAVHCSPSAPMPMVIGLIRPIVVLPEQAPGSWSQPQWEAVLLHEAAHIARLDPWAVFAQRLAVILFWWCPLVHLLSRRLNDLREAICDDYALEGPCDRIAYAELLVGFAERLVNLRARPGPVGLIDSARGGLEKRITRLLEKEKEPMKKLSLTGKLLGVSVLVMACLSITAATAYCQTPPAKRVQIKIIVDGQEIDLNDANLDAFLPAVKPKPDPRVEELVRAAEAIKPGSGAEVRLALQGMTKPGQRAFEVARDQKPPAAAVTFRVSNVEDGRRVIVTGLDARGEKVTLGVADAQAVQDLMRALEAPGVMKDGQVVLPSEAVRVVPPLAESTTAPPKTRIVPPKAGDAARAIAPPLESDEEALASQLKRISAELQELRKRLDAKKLER
jgi:beta-lactamase regulating signal transducer with metallopeptidase domain